MSGNGWNCWKWLDMDGKAGNEREFLEWLGMARNCWECMDGMA